MLFLNNSKVTSTLTISILMLVLSAFTNAEMISVEMIDENKLDHSPSAHDAIDFSNLELPEGKGILLANVKSIGDGSRLVKSIRLQYEGSGKHIDIPADGRKHAIVASAGIYKPVGFSYIKNGAIKYKAIETSSALDNFHLLDNAVNYFGNWRFRHKRSGEIGDNASTFEVNQISVKFDPAAVMQHIASNSWTKDYPLAISGGNGKRLVVQWSSQYGDYVASR